MPRTYQITGITLLINISGDKGHGKTVITATLLNQLEPKSAQVMFSLFTREMTEISTYSWYVQASFLKSKIYESPKSFFEFAHIILLT